MAKRDSNAVSSDLADLRGARYVMTSETEPGQKLSQATVKFLTQGQGKRARARLRQDWITFRETHSIWLDCNTLLSMPDDVEDPALRRLVPIDSERKISRDGLTATWATSCTTLSAVGHGCVDVQGAVKWFRSGQKLNHPPEIDIARNYWRRTDPFVRFVEDCCVVDAGRKVSARAATEEFLRWWKAAGLHGEPLTETLFGTRMEKRFPESKHTETGRVYLGVGLPRTEIE